MILNDPDSHKQNKKINTGMMRKYHFSVLELRMNTTPYKPICDFLVDVLQKMKGVFSFLVKPTKKPCGQFIKIGEIAHILIAQAYQKELSSSCSERLGSDMNGKKPQFEL